MTFPVDLFAWDSFPIDTVAFWVFAAVMLGCALFVVTAKRLFHAGIAMVGCFVCVAALYALLNAPFMAGLQLLVYVGAIATLLLFAVMLTDKMMEPKSGTTFFQPAMGIFASIMMFIMLSMIIVTSNFATPDNAVPALGNVGLRTPAFVQPDPNAHGSSPDEVAAAIDMKSLDVTNIGMRMLTPYVLPFELISVIILATLIGAIVIARKEDRPIAAEIAKADEAVAPETLPE